MKSSTLFLSCLLLAANSLSSDVTSWRNGGYGLYPDATPPLYWEDPASILWQVPTPIRGNACPLLIGNKLFYTAEPTELICADARTGKVLWQRSNSYEDVADITPEERIRIKNAIVANEQLAAKLKPFKKRIYQLTRRLRNDRSNEELKDQLKAAQNEQAELEAAAGNIPAKFKKPKTHNTNGYASYTSCSDGKYIFTCNSLGIVTKHDLDGNRIWAKVMEKPDHNWGGAVSPQLIDGKLILRFADYAALDPETGKELWRVKDPQTFGPPASFQLEGKWFLYTVRGELIRVSDGKKLKSQDWTIKQKTFAFFNTPFVSENRIYVVHGAAGIQGDVYCMEIPDTLKELERRGLKRIWHTVASKERYYTSPLAHEGLLYIFSMGQVFQVLDAETGEIIYSHKISGMRGRAFSGILLVNDKIYVGEENGVAVFIEPGRIFKELSRYDLGENRSTPIFEDNIAYLRTIDNLFALKAKDG
ncbi:MAG: PQQ-binding-like beta-propeller repeat protein [Verrucomicrobia bacterium]|nr:PQQ-binding-like beta-propeller repeat protein [Verrucomicrobiota bacterium]